MSAQHGSRILDFSEGVWGLLGLAWREIENRCNLDSHRELVGMRQAVTYFGKHNLFLGSDEAPGWRVPRSLESGFGTDGLQSPGFTPVRPADNAESVIVQDGASPYGGRS
jgi:hypothetical protein